MTGGAFENEAQVVAALQESTRGTLGERMGIVITSASRERVVGTMPVEGNTQPYGLLHGGASCVLAESLASLGAALHGWPDRIAMGVDINATHHRGVRSGIVTGTATPLHQGRTVATWAVTIVDEEGRLVCSARLTCALRES
ncbi:MAG: 1,4-dihydroxy-2-naphthoyl-CoA hydrolase [Frankiaceae bacterium]|nr:1,4-dihydroxy-2-naphthoyl-CoA hydrolase [Frankiaceae bacterium]